MVGRSEESSSPCDGGICRATTEWRAADIKLINMRPYGAFGRLQLGGKEADIREAVTAIEKALGDIQGKPNEGRG